ncbi:hypothetical protein RclHR1_16360001 [Rhizophagus clarus]|uniref:Uncharacterized protein n=1 Tax=Rhizophagus clarus TaxID=94130 RepID=A0A2Z6QY55_9GLOM|nr:hypothetical protein RclHR1_16360001 [Rhizophagus clarus]GET01932.1 hypothetical protein RCL_jg12937.t1 [Rhizophagus clarus]
MIKDLWLQVKEFQIDHKNIQQLLLWNSNFFAYTIGFNQELPIPFAHLLLRNFFPKEKYKELKNIVKSEKATLTIAIIFLEIFINEFYNIIWQPRYKIVAEWEHIKGIKKQDLKKKIPAY